MIYVILDLKRYRTLYVGQTIQRLDKRISDHIRNMQYLQRFGAYKPGCHKSLITYRLAVKGIHDICVLPWLCFRENLKPTWPLPGTGRFRKFVENLHEFPLAERLNCF